jgi:hypothetical protein
LSGAAGVEDWAAVSDAIRKRMRELKMSTAHLARETGLSETTIRYIGSPASGHNKSTLVAISAVLRWRHDHLINILRGEPDKNVPMKRQAEASLQRLLYDEINPVKEQLASLRETIEVMGTKIDVIIKGQRRSAGAAKENLRLTTSRFAAAGRPDSRSGQLLG